MLVYGFEFMKPSVVALGIYHQFLGNSFAAPRTAKNHLSDVKSWLQLHGGYIGSFSTLELSMITKSIGEKNSHVPSQALPITEWDMQTICEYIRAYPQHPGIKAAILLAFSTFMRVSNVLSLTITLGAGGTLLI